MIEAFVAAAARCELVATRERYPPAMVIRRVGEGLAVGAAFEGQGAANHRLAQRARADHAAETAAVAPE